jgi:hypothetical protein
MKKHVPLILLCLFLLAACSKAKGTEFTIVVSGTEGIGFSANLGGASIIDGPSGQSFEGTIPAEYKVRGTAIGCTFQKLSDDGVMVINILRDGKLVFLSGTNEPQGVVIAAASGEQASGR